MDVDRNKHMASGKESWSERCRGYIEGGETEFDGGRRKRKKREPSREWEDMAQGKVGPSLRNEDRQGNNTQSAIMLLFVRPHIQNTQKHRCRLIQGGLPKLPKWHNSSGGITACSNLPTFERGEDSTEGT